MVIQALNYLIVQVGAAINGLLSLLPSSPLSVDPTVLAGIATVMGYASYFLPIHESVLFIQALITAIVVYYAVRIALRWLKVSAS